MNPPQGNKGEGMREIAKEVWQELNKNWMTAEEQIDCVEATLFGVAAKARAEALTQAANLCARVRCRNWDAEECARHIRALSAPQTQQSKGDDK